MSKASFTIITGDSGRSILLTRRKDVPVWVLPGGGIEPGESPEEAAVRESLEETGIHVQVLRCTGYYTPINNLAKETYVHLALPISGDPSITSETSAIGYFPLERLPKNLFFVHRDWIHDWQFSGGTMVTKKITQVTYFNMILYAICHPLNTLRFLWTRLSGN